MGIENQIKVFRSLRDSVLKKWDVSFEINGEVLKSVLDYLVDINFEIPFKFYNDKIFIHQKSVDNIQYTEIEINANDVLDYNHSIPDDAESKSKIKSLVRAPDGSAEGDYKIILLDMKGTLEELDPYIQKEGTIKIRIDTIYDKKIEFHCPNNVIIWSRLMDPGSATGIKDLARMPAIVSRVRNDPNIKKAQVILEPSTFANICNLGGKGKKRDIDERIFIELNKQDGMMISSGDQLRGRLFELKAMGSFNPPGSMEGTEGMENTADTGMMENMEGMGDVPGDIPEELAGLEEVPTGDPFEQTGINEEGYAIPGGFGDNKSKDKRKKEGTERKKPDAKGQIDQLLGLEADVPQYVYLQKEYVIPFTKLKGLSPIIIEVRTDKPVVIDQKPYNGISAMLTIAPRIENEDDK